MGEAKRRKQLDPNFGKSLQNFSNGMIQLNLRFSLLSELLNLSDPKLVELLGFVSPQGFQQGFKSELDFHEFKKACSRYPKLFFLWTQLVYLNQILDLGSSSSLTNSKIEFFWTSFWRLTIPVLGDVKLHIEDPFIRYWLLRLNGILILTAKRLPIIVDTSNSSTSDIKSAFSMGDTSLQVGLMFQTNPSNIIYASSNLIVWKGSDSETERGELMIAVKHVSGCWNHYPSADNLPVPLSDYKKAKANLKQVAIPLKGELLHPQSAKLARLFGLQVVENYAFVTPSRSVHKTLIF